VKRRKRIDLDRLRRAVRLDVQPDGMAGFIVSGGAEEHHVRFDGRWKRYTCSCPDRAIRGVACKHLLRIGIELGTPAITRALREVVDPPTRTRKAP